MFHISTLTWCYNLIMEEVDSISVAVSKIDINKVDPLENRRVVAFLNHFLCTTVTFLNQFAVKCEHKLDQIQQKLFKIESALRILESKLESLPVDEHLSNITTTTTRTDNNLESKPLQSQNPNLLKTETSTPDVASDLNNTNLIGLSSGISSLQKSPDFNAEESEQKSAEDEHLDNPSSTQSNRQDPRYEKYFKMMYVGVPVPAIKQKMMSEGVDPSILDS